MDVGVDVGVALGGARGLPWRCGWRSGYKSCNSRFVVIVMVELGDVVIYCVKQWLIA